MDKLKHNCFYNSYCKINRHFLFNDIWGENLNDEEDIIENALSDHKHYIGT